MKVTIEYIDNASFTKEEIIRNSLHRFGKAAKIEVLPDSTNAHDFIYYGIQQIITQEQLSILYSDKSTYQKDITKLRANVLNKIIEILDTVIIDNESKVL